MTIGDDEPEGGRSVQAHWDVAAVRTSPAWLRARVRARCASWGLGEDATDDLLLVLTELVSNVVDHAGTPMSVHLRYDDRTVRVWVHDGSPAVPRLRPHDPTAGRGRGLQLVDALSTRWGWATRAGGKTLWAVLTPAG